MANYLEERLRNIKKDDYFNEIPPFPRSIMIEVTNACNQRCEFCFSKGMKRKRGYISESFVRRILEETYHNGAKEAGFTTTGEPLLNKNIFDYVEFAKKTGFQYTYFSTNGSLFNKDAIRKLFLSQIDSIKFSINAGSRATYVKIHGKDDFVRVIANVVEIDRLRKKNGSNLKMFVSFVFTDYNRHELDILKKSLRGCIDEFIVENHVDAVGPTNSSKYSLPCPLLFNRMHITHEGYITCCCVDYENNLVVADLNKSSVKEAWHGMCFKEFRKRHLAKDVSGTLCALCIFKKDLEFKPLLYV